MRRAHLVAIIDSLGGGGAERVLSTLANYLAPRHHVTLLTLVPDPPDAYPLDPIVRRLVMPYPPPPKSGWAARFALPRHGWRVGQRLRAMRPRPDLLLGFLPNSNIVAGFAGLGAGVPFVVAEQSHPAVLDDMASRARHYRWFVYRYARLLIAQSSEAAVWARPFLPARRIAVLPNLLNLAPPASSSGEPILLAAGRTIAGKGFAELIDAFAAVAERYPSWRLRIVGEGPHHGELRGQVERLGLQTRVELPGWAPDMGAEYARASIFVHPSHSEGLPNVVLEALGHGLPCLVTDSFPDCRELIRPERDGLVIPVRAPEALRGALERLLEDGQLRRQLGEAGRLRVERFGLEQAGPVWERALATAGLR